jgi:hypothetical protein
MTVRAALGRRGPAVAAMVVGALIMVGGSLLAWLRTGGRRRHSYELFDLVERLGFAPDGIGAWALRWWPLMPLLAVLAVVAAWWGWPWAGGAIGIVAALYGGGVSLAVGTVSSPAVDIARGPAVTAVGAVILLGGSLWCIAAAARDRRRVRSSTDPVPPGRPAARPVDRS